MLKLQWDALSLGDNVFLHDAADADYALLDGEVVIVDTVVGSTDNVVIRADSGCRVIRPERLMVQSDPLDPGERCWRCDMQPSRQDMHVRMIST